MIIGRGLSGLCAAAMAAKAGLSVVVLEKASEPGGRAATTEKQGFALYRGGPACAAVDTLGVDYSVEETASALALSTSNVKTTHHRARRALEPYEQSRCRPTPDLVARSTAALQRFLTSLMADDVAAAEVELAEGVVALNDGGGEFFAARRPVVGASRVAELNLGVKRMSPDVSRWEIRILNGLPALVAERDGVSAKDAPRFVVRCDIDGSGRITAIHTILARSKLTAVKAIRAL